MVNRPLVRSSIVAALALLLFLTVLIGGGLRVRGLIARSFESAERIRAIEALALQTLQLQLDEETGIRGYIATHDRAFLEPYHAARPQLAAVFGQLGSSIDANDTGIAEARPTIATAAALNARWVRTVAEPFERGTVRDPRTRQVAGKRLVDRFRAAIAATNRVLSGREAQIDSEAQAAIGRVLLLVVAAATLVAALAALAASMQYRTTLRLEAQRRQAEEQRRKATDLQAAYLAEKRIADTLQDAFSQRPLPLHPLLRFSAMYVPATEEARVGGDWYDALELPGNRVLFAIGDVTGHGLDAAVGMSRARQEMIAAALADAQPASILHRVNGELLRQGSPLVTAVVGYADAASQQFIYSIAGHPPPVLLEPGRPPRLLDCGALPLGTLADAQYKTYVVDAAPGSLLVLYTDGAVEHSRNVLDGETLLLDAAQRALNSGAVHPASVIHDTIFGGNPAGDDVAILTVGFDHVEGDGFVVSASHANSDFVGRIGSAGEPAVATLARRARSLARWAS